ncbi:unnamed protein product [Porites lobata]|uniref:Fibrinogen C-terminal domain-containing protein n=1 Tax=Porites lobata TaxID=104759 RepID=A0ABN8P5X5_9CNID|nr:unnamed protein product [Porites lobata]
MVMGEYHTVSVKSLATSAGCYFLIVCYPFSICICDLITNVGGWTVFQKRLDGSVDFFRNWESYKNGFGDLNKEFCLGNDNLHRLTFSEDVMLRVDMEDFDGNIKYAEYTTFQVADEADKYRILIGGYSGTAGDSNMQFTTKDADNDLSPISCAQRHSGGWWFNRCSSANPNGLYHNGPYSGQYSDGAKWVTFRGHFYSLKRIEMKLKPKTVQSAEEKKLLPFFMTVMKTAESFQATYVATSLFSLPLKQSVCESSNLDLCGNKGICIPDYSKDSFTCKCDNGYTGTRCEFIIEDCSKLGQSGLASTGIYYIIPDGGSVIQVLCDMTTNSGGWTVFQRRLNGSVDFFQGWESYKNGFGDLNGEFWLGNDNLHRLTASSDVMLRVDMEDFDGNITHAEYTTFQVADEADKYRITIGGYNGTAGDSMPHKWHLNLQFSTKDVDSDLHPDNCAVLLSGAWWYHSCSWANLNGLYRRGSYNTSYLPHGVKWVTFRGQYYSLKRTEMKLKPKP